MSFKRDTITLSNFQKKNIFGNGSISFEDIFTKLNESIQLKNDITVYVDLGSGPNNKYSKECTQEESIFINRCVSNDTNINSLLNQELNQMKYYFITSNSFNPNLSKQGSVDINRFKVISKKFNYIKNYNINENGYILILLNNIRGCFGEYYANVIEKLENLVKNIREYSNRKIVLRFHRKQYHILTIQNDPFTEKVNKFVKEYNITLDHVIKEHNYTQYLSNETINDTYCVFIQNTKLVLDFIHKGIPVFNLNFSPFNYFPEINIKELSLIEKLKENENLLPNRKSVLKKYYYHIYFPDEIICDTFKDSLEKFL